MLMEMMPPIDGMGIICYGSVVNKSEAFWRPASADRDEDFSGANRSLRILWCQVCLPAWYAIQVDRVFPSGGGHCGLFAVSTVRRSWEVGPGCDMSWKNNDLPGRSGNQSVSQSVSLAVGWSVGWLVSQTDSRS